MEWLTSESITISVITLTSLLVNAITIYRWISERGKEMKLNNQSFHMVMGLAHANTQRVNMIVKRIKVLEKQDKENDEAMIFLENMYADSKSNIESLLATAKALKPDQANILPYDSDSLLAKSVVERDNITTNIKCETTL